MSSASIYTIEAPAAWVKEYPVAAVDHEQESPLRFLLVEYQELIDQTELHSYCRTYQHVNDASKVEEASLQLVDLHLGTQTLVLHHLDIYRDGEKIDAIDPENIRAIQRERSLEQHIVDNKITVSISVDDLRVGDYLSYAYTIVESQSDHPFHGKHFSRTFSLSWGCPVDVQVIRVVNRRANPLTLLLQTTATDYNNVTRQSIEGQSEYEQEFTQLPMERIPQAAPEWIWAGFMQITSQTSWREQSQYLSDYFDQNQATQSLDLATVEQLNLFQSEDDLSSKILAIIRFVQNQIRYRGENHGVFTHTPKPAAKTLKKRAGDCKDKSNLMVRMLDAIGVSARMVLVNTRFGSKVEKLNPSPYQFDHMIVELSHNSKTYYFDATIQNQAGDFEHLAELDYRFGLPIDTAGADLVDIQRRLDQRVFHLTHTFDFQGTSETPTLHIKRVYFRHRADNMRGYFAATEKEKYQQDFLEWAKDDTGLKLETIKPVHIVSDRLNENCLQAEEEYKIVDIANTHGDKPIGLLTDFYQNFPLTNEDDFPVRVDLDGELVHEIHCVYKRRPELQTSKEIIKTSAFSYKDVVENTKGNTLHYLVKVSPSKRYVEAGEALQEHRKSIELMQNRSRSLIRHQNKAWMKFHTGQLWWLAVLLYVAWVVYRN